MAVGGPGRLLPAGGGEDGRFPEGAPGVQQEQLQQIPCGFRLQGFQPPALGVFAHQRIPLGTDYRDREDEHPPALPPPAVGQKECGQEAGPGAGGAGGGEFGSAAENRPDREPGHDRGHLKKTHKKKTQKKKNPGIREFPRLFPPLSPPPHWEFPGSALFIIWDLSPFFFGDFFFGRGGICIYGIFMGKGGIVRPWGSCVPKIPVFFFPCVIPGISNSQNSRFFPGFFSWDFSLLFPVTSWNF